VRSGRPVRSLLLLLLMLIIIIIINYHYLKKNITNCTLLLISFHLSLSLSLSLSIYINMSLLINLISPAAKLQWGPTGPGRDPGSDQIGEYTTAPETALLLPQEHHTD